MWPTSVDVEPGGSLLLVENGLRRLVRILPSGRVTEIAALAKPYAVRRAPSGNVFVTDGPTLLRIDGTSAPAKVASADLDEGRLLSHLTIAFSDGVTWEFDIPKAAKKTAQGLVNALGGTFS